MTGAFPLRLPGLRKRRLAWILIHVGLVLFSSTNIAGQASEYAFQFYRDWTGLDGGAGLHLLADKGVHFSLFFTLGLILYYSLIAPTREKVLWVLLACLLVGSASEGLQFYFPGRHPSLADVMLNGVSGLLGAVFVSCMAARANFQAEVTTGSR